MQLSRAHIKAFVDEPYFSRGEKYYKDGSVKFVSRTKNAVKARVVGSAVYTVQLSLKNNKLGGSCTCPAFRDFGPCKHSAAVGFAVMGCNEGIRFSLSRDNDDQVDEYEAFEKTLRRKTKNELISMIVEINGIYPDIMYAFMEE